MKPSTSELLTIIDEICACANAAKGDALVAQDFGRLPASINYANVIFREHRLQAIYLLAGIQSLLETKLPQWLEE